MRTKFIRLLFVMSCLFCGSASFGQAPFIQYEPIYKQPIDPLSIESNQKTYIIKAYYIKNNKFRPIRIKIQPNDFDEIIVISYLDNYRWKEPLFFTKAEKVDYNDPDYITENFEYKANIDSKTIYF